MLSVAVPTFNRGPVLVDTLRYLFDQKPAPTEILVLDQTKRHQETIEALLSSWHQDGKILWKRLPRPSITKAMNYGLLAATYDKILFLDDDIVPESGLVAAHLRALEQNEIDVVAGRIIQPWEEGKDASPAVDFCFAQEQATWTGELMAGNFSIFRDVALAVGGFDENFVHVGYHFEAEFAHRLLKANHRIYFEPAACIHHLKSSQGGTRTFGDHLKTFRPSHSVGAYYFQLRARSGLSSVKAILRRGVRAIANRHHLRKPWWIPATAVAELLGVMWALSLAIRGPRLLTSRSQEKV